MNNMYFPFCVRCLIQHSFDIQHWPNNIWSKNWSDISKFEVLLLFSQKYFWGIYVLVFRLAHHAPNLKMYVNVLQESKCMYSQMFLIISCPGSSIPDLGHWVSQWVSQFNTKSDFRDLRQRDKKTKWRKHKKMKRHKDEKMISQKEKNTEIFKYKDQKVSDVRAVSHSCNVF